MSASKVKVDIEKTNDENRLRFRFNQEISDRTVRFADIADTFQSPLANKIFGFPWAESVTISHDYVDIEKQDWVEWEVLQKPLAGLLKEHLEMKLPVFSKPESAAPAKPANVTVNWEETPNPQALKFLVNQQISDDMHEFLDMQQAEASPLAEKIFSLPWVAAVFIGQRFVTVTKQDWAEWESLKNPMCQLITDELNSGIRVEPVQGDSQINDSDTDQVKLIKKILNDEIRPAVAQDGGDIVFHKYEEKRLYLFMKGACSGCPSSTATLKVGIESRLKQEIPDLEDVIAV